MYKNENPRSKNKSNHGKNKNPNQVLLLKNKTISKSWYQPKIKKELKREDCKKKRPKRERFKNMRRTWMSITII